MYKGSRHSWLATFEVGERRYIETTFAAYPDTMRLYSQKREWRPKEIRDWDFTLSLFTAVSHRRAEDVRYLICVERTK